ncbi:hypothetical protein [Sporofaciens sp. JLR.KK001]|uniref:hypothetical protein n=1 Tax=Sporofaciens sp. JLR.KK001 TaxID=3112621 RepID=UPI002FF03A61
MKKSLKIQIPTKPGLQKKYNELSRFEGFLLYCIIAIDSNLFVFLGGVLISIPVTILLNIVSYEMIFTLADDIYIVSYIFSFFSSLFLSINYIALTIRHIEIRNSVDGEKNIEVYNNKLFETGYSNLKYLKKKSVCTVIFFIFMLFAFCFCFVCKNYSGFVENCIKELINFILC